MERWRFLNNPAETLGAWAARLPHPIERRVDCYLGKDCCLRKLIYQMLPTRRLRAALGCKPHRDG
jgi:hypothetical protein